MEKRLLAAFAISALAFLAILAVGEAWAPAGEHDHHGDMPPVRMLTRIEVEQGFWKNKWIRWMYTERLEEARPTLKPALWGADMELKLHIESPHAKSTHELPFRVGWNDAVTLEILWRTRDRGQHILKAEIWEEERLWDTEVEIVWV